MKDELFEEVDRANRKYGFFQAGDRVLVAVSGGVDSVSLLHILGDPRFGLRRVAAYVHHGLRPEADQEARWIGQLAEAEGIAYHILPVDVRERARQRGESIQMAARAERYRALKQLAEQCKVNRIALGHHANDQAETLLIRLLTGTGIEGLGGMAPVSGVYIRPFLHCLRAEIENYATAHGLTWMEDRSNRDPHYLRNKIRIEILPQFETIQPQVVAHLSQLSSLAGEYRDWMEKELEYREKDLDFRNEIDPPGISWSSATWSELAAPLKRAVIKRAFYRLFPEQRLENVHVDWMMETAGSSDQGRTQLPGAGYFVLNGSRMIIQTESESKKEEPYNFPVIVPGETECPGGKLIAQWVSENELPVDWRNLGHNEAYFGFAGEEPRFFLRNRRHGDRVRLFGHTKHEKLKKLLIDQKIPRSRRDRIPLLTDGEDLIWWVVGVQRGDAGKVGSASPRILYLRFIPEIDL